VAAASTEVCGAGGWKYWYVGGCGPKLLLVKKKNNAKLDQALPFG